MDFSSISRVVLWGDLERVVPRKKQRILLTYRILQAMNKRVERRGCLNKKIARRVVAELSDVSEKTVRRVFASGNGTWWHLQEDSLILIGHTKIAKRFRVVGAGKPVYMRLSRLSGGLGKFRSIILAMHVHAVQVERRQPGGIEISRKALAKKAGISVSTLKQRGQWLEVIPQVEAIGRVAGQDGAIVMAEYPEISKYGYGNRRARTWLGEDGSTFIVRQRRNLYRARFGGVKILSGPVQYKLPPVSRYPVEFGERFACLEPAPVDFEPVGAVVWTPLLDGSPALLEQDKRLGGTMGPAIVPPPGWSATTKREEEPFEWVN